MVRGALDLPHLRQRCARYEHAVQWRDLIELSGAPYDDGMRSRGKYRPMQRAGVANQRCLLSNLGTRNVLDAQQQQCPVLQPQQQYRQENRLQIQLPVFTRL